MPRRHSQNTEKENDIALGLAFYEWLVNRAILIGDRIEVLVLTVLNRLHVHPQNPVSLITPGYPRTLLISLFLHKIGAYQMERCFRLAQILST